MAVGTWGFSAGNIMKQTILLIFILLSSGQAHAAEAQMPIMVTIIVCPRDDLPKACDRESRCCYLLDDATGVETAGQDSEETPPIRLAIAPVQ